MFNEILEKFSKLEARVAELERRLSERFPSGVTLTIPVSGEVSCPKCGVSGQVYETGVILTSMPPLTEKGCKNCNHKWGVATRWSGP